MAEQLENAGRTGDNHYIDANLQNFFHSLSTLLTNIRNYLNAIRKEKTVQDKKADFDFLKSSLAGIGQHMDNLDIDAVENIQSKGLH